MREPRLAAGWPADGGRFGPGPSVAAWLPIGITSTLAAQHAPPRRSGSSPALPRSQSRRLAPTEGRIDAPAGFVSTVFRPQEPDAIEAAFPRESYRPGRLALLRLWSTARDASVQVFRIGPERARTVGNNELRGVPVTAPRRVGPLRRRRVVRSASATGRAASTSRACSARAEGRLRPVRRRAATASARNRVAVVMPTRTWQAYNFRDDDGDGGADTWYADQGRIFTARLGRPFLNRGVPPHFRNYDLPFLHWLHTAGKRVDCWREEDLDETSGAALARAYDLLVFPGHHEYVTTREYDAVEGFRDRGGSLALPVGEQLLLADRAARPRHAPHRALARAGTPGSGAARRPVHRLRRGHAPRPLARPPGRGPELDLRGRPAAPRRRVLQRGHRDRRDRAQLAARHEGRWPRSRTCSVPA